MNLQWPTASISLNSFDYFKCNIFSVYHFFLLKMQPNLTIKIIAHFTARKSQHESSVKFLSISLNFYLLTALKANFIVMKMRNNDGILTKR